MSGLSPEVTAKIGVGATRLARAAATLGNASDPSQGRAAMGRAADVLVDLAPGSPLIPKLRDTSDLDDSQIVDLCQQMAISLAGQASAMAKVVEGQTAELKSSTASRRWWKFWK